MKCPHCEEGFEVNVASVTRSRACPACGKTVFLQMLEGSFRRRALLVQREEFSVAGVVAANPLPYLPKALTEEEIDQQRKDPESRLLLAKLMAGVGGLVLLIGVMILTEGEGVPQGDVLEQVERPIQQKVVREEPKVEVVEAPAAKVDESQGAKGFELLFRERPSRPIVIRVWAQEGVKYGGIFWDSGWLRCVDLRSAEEPEGRVLRAYVARTSDTGGAVDFRLRQGGSEAQQWTVKVRYPPDAEEPNQVWLDEVVADGWELVQAHSKPPSR